MHEVLTMSINPIRNPGGIAMDDHKARNVPWIITSLADVDFYKLTMLQFIWFMYRNVKVIFRFKNRTQIKLPEHIDLDEIERQLRHVSEFVTFQSGYIDLLRRDYGHIFRDEFLDWLAKIRLPMPCVGVGADGHLRIEVEGTWCETMLWETISMCIVNRLYFLERMSALDLNEEDVLDSGMSRLNEKIDFFLQHPGLMFTDFGTRRRWSSHWHRVVLERILHCAPDSLSGTSNVMLGLDLGIALIGTMAHEMDMGLQGVHFAEDERTGYMWSHAIEQEWPVDAVAFPDEGAYKRFKRYFPDKHHVICEKRRDGDERVVTIKEGDPRDKNVLIIDDLIISGGTTIECSKVLQSAGSREVRAAAPHLVAPDLAATLFCEDGPIGAIAHLYVTNSILAEAYVFVDDTVRLIDLDRLIQEDMLLNVGN